MADERPINLTVTLPSGSVMIPSWLMLCLIGCFVLSVISLLLVWEANRRVVGEVRVLQLYEQDIENVLIRGGVATRSDFAPHPETGDDQQKQKEKR